MKKYDPEATCVKCGCANVQDVFSDAESQASCNMANNFNKMAGRHITPREPRPEHIERTCNNCGYSWDEMPMDKPLFDAEYKRCWPNKEEIQKYMDNLADVAAPALGIPAEMLKSRMVDDPAIEVRDVVRSKNGCGYECTAFKVGEKISAHAPTDRCACCNEADRFELIRKGPKVHRFEGVAIAELKSDSFEVFSPHHKIGFDALSKTYDLTLTEEASK